MGKAVNRARSLEGQPLAKGKERKTADKAITRRRFLQKGGAALGLGLAALYGLDASCAPTPAPKAEELKRVVIAQGADAATMDPQNHGITITGNVLAHIYDSLGQRNPQKNYQYEGLLVESWDIVDDLTVDLKLRKGVTFSNGEPFNAEVVKYNIDRLTGKLPGVEKPFGARWVPKLKDAEVLDDHTVRVTATEVDVFLVQRLLDLEMVPKKYTEEHGFEKLALEPVGTGPYVLKEWVKEEHITLTRRDDYWRGKAAIAEVVFRPIPEDATRIAELQAGNVDIILNVPPDSVPVITSDPNLEVRTVASARNAMVIFDTERDTPLSMKHPKVRQALNYAVDRDAIIKHVLGGYGIKTATVAPDYFIGYDPAMKPYPYDPEKARQLLAEAGYPDGFEIEDFRVGRGRFLRNAEVAEAITDQLGKVGVKVTLNAMEFGVWAKDTNEHIIGDMSFAALGNSYFDAWNTIFTLCRTDNVWSWYSNPEVDKYIDEAGSTLDPAKHEAALKKALELLYEDPPFIFMYQLMDVYGINKGVKWHPRSDELVYMYEAS